MLHLPTEHNKEQAELPFVSSSGSVLQYATVPEPKLGRAQPNTPYVPAIESGYNFQYAYFDTEEQNPVMQI